MSAEAIWIAGLFVGLALGIPVGLLLDRVIALMSADDRGV
jgi:hypothetical protein